MSSFDTKKFSDNITTTSVWSATQSKPPYSPLSENLSVDVCIVGGGIAGLTTAYLLQKEGKKVCVLEAFEIAGGQTALTTAHFATALDDRYFEIEHHHGQKGSRIAAKSHRAAIEKVVQIVKEENIDCELEMVDGYLFAKGDDRPNVLERELEAARRAGVRGVDTTSSSPLPSFDTGPCLKFSDQMQLHPLKYLTALAEKISARGGLIYTHTKASEFHGGDSAYVKTESGYTVKCNSIVVATNSPVNNLFAIHTKQAPYRTYVVGFKVPKGSIPSGLYWDTLDPYHYIRLERGATADDDALKDYISEYDILIVGGEDHKTGQDEHPEQCYENLKRWTRAHFPMVTDVVSQWSGQVMEPADGMAFLGHNPMDRDNVYIITGDSGNGMTHCTIGAILITDQIMGRKNDWEELYNPSRITMNAEFMKENLNVAAQYGDWLKPKPRPHFPDLAPEEGVVFRDGLQMVAAYKDKNSKMTFMSATCTHLAGVVSWNNVEKSWDCPCHGSRFDHHGQVIEGPAITDLKKLDDWNESFQRESKKARSIGMDQPSTIPPEHRRN